MTASWFAALVVTMGACADQSTPRAAVAASRPTLTAARPDDIELYSAGQLSRVADELAHGSTTARTIGGHPNFHYVEARRVANGEPEVHDGWVDVTIVQAGKATLLTGGRVEGGQLASAGEHRGGSIVGGSSHAIAAGDLFVIPAGTPHQYQIARGDSVRYLTLKVLAH